MDDRDKAKAAAGRRYVELLREADPDERWACAFVRQDPSCDRAGVSWWERQSIIEMRHLLVELRVGVVGSDTGLFGSEARAAVLDLLDARRELSFEMLMSVGGGTEWRDALVLAADRLSAGPDAVLVREFRWLTTGEVVTADERAAILGAAHFATPEETEGWREPYRQMEVFWRRRSAA